MWWGSVCVDLSIFPLLCCNRFHGCAKHYIFLFSSRSVYGGFSLVDCSPCLLVWRCPIFLFLDFSRCFLMSFSMRPGQVLGKSCLVALRRLAVGMKSDTWRYCVSSGLVVWSRMSFSTTSDCCVSKETSQVLICLFLVPLAISCTFFKLAFLDFWVWLCIHNHIRLPMILVGLF